MWARPATRRIFDETRRRSEGGRTGEQCGCLPFAALDELQKSSSIASSIPFWDSSYESGSGKRWAGGAINIGSTASQLTPPTTAVYTATKGAVDAVTRVLAKELGPKKIRVNSINPGMVETEGTHAAGVIGSDWQKQLQAQTPLGRIAQPDDIAPIAVFLACRIQGG
jgi:NAD(P)-dependent dehydrogenase (short-subunit alcohol dehydrogenase family)